jgi:hypothetical protein
VTHFDLVVLGAGPTAVFAYHLMRTAFPSVRLVGSYSDASVSPVSTPFGPVSLVPVFPPADPPDFPPSVPADSNLSVTRFGASEWVDDIDESSGSLLSFLRRDRDSGAMALKQYGARARTEAMSEVQRKVSRAYGSTPMPRAGYVDGVSPYLAPMRSILDHVDPAPTTVERWRPHDHEVTLVGDSTPLTYDRLVYSTGLDGLIAALDLQIPSPVRAPARFGLFTSDEALEVNRLVYDLRRESPVFRVFTPRARVALVQNSVLDPGDDDVAPTIQALGEIFGTTFESMGRAVSLPGAYPVESLAADDDELLDATAAAVGVLRFGRNATSRYVDLHELSWSHLMEWCSA